MTSTNPFTFGNPISDPNRFSGRRQEVEQIYSRLRNSEFESTSIIGNRRMGKSSLLNYVSDPGVMLAHSLDPKKYFFLSVDLQMAGASSTPARLYQHILRLIRTKVGDPELTQQLEDFQANDSLDTYDLSECFDLVDAKSLYIVLLLDEFEHIGTNTAFGPEFYYGMRSLAIHHNLALVTASYRELVELSHSEDVRSSPFFNIFASIHLRPFSPADSQDLVEGYLEGSEVAFNEQETKELTGLAGGNPFLLQMASHFLYTTYQEGYGDENRLQVVKTAFSAESQPHLVNYWQNTSEGEKALLVLMSLLESRASSEKVWWSVSDLEKWYHRSGTAMASLERRGLTIRENQEYRIFSPAFVRLITDEVTSPKVLDPESPVAEDQKEPSMPSLPEPTRTRVSQWLASTDTQYQELFQSWLSNASTVEAAYELLQEFQGLFVSGRRMEDERVKPAPRETQPTEAYLPGWDDVELVITPRPEPPALMQLCQWLTETAKADIEEMAVTGSQYLSIRIFLKERVPLVDLLSVYPEVAGVREEDAGGDGQRDHFSRRRSEYSGGSAQPITRSQPARHVRVTLKATGSRVVIT